MSQRIRFGFDGPRSWMWSFEDPPQDVTAANYSPRRSYTVLICNTADRWAWNVIGLFGNGLSFDEMDGKADSMQGCIDAATKLFSKAGVEVEIPMPLSN